MPSRFLRRRRLQRRLATPLKVGAGAVVAAVLLFASQARSNPPVRCAGGLFCFLADAPARADEVNANFALLMDRSVPIGAILMWTGTTPPPGWVLCDGQVVMRSDGAGPLTTPDLRSRFIVGAGAGTTLSSYAVGATGGAETVTLTQAQLPAHTHNVLDPGHRHNSVDQVFQGQPLGNGSSRYSGGGADAFGHGGTPYLTSSAGTGISIGMTGLGAAVPTRPPFFALAFIMKQ